jgi:hypothetical protein
LRFEAFRQLKRNTTTYTHQSTELNGDNAWRRGDARVERFFSGSAVPNVGEPNGDPCIATEFDRERGLDSSICLTTRRLKWRGGG